LNNKGEKAGAPFNSSLFGKSVGIDALEKRIEKSAEIIKTKKLKERTKQIVSVAMKTCKTRIDFEKALEKQGISVLFRENEQGRIYGATFIDHEQKCVFNGSRLGKDFSANVFNELFNDNLSPKSQASFQSQSSNKDFEENSKPCGIFDLFNFDNSTNNDFEEQIFANKHKKRKKKQIRI